MKLASALSQDLKRGESQQYIQILQCSSLGGYRAWRASIMFYRLLEAEHQHIVDKKPYTFRLIFPYNLAFINFTLPKPSQTNRKSYVETKLSLAHMLFLWATKPIRSYENRSGVVDLRRLNL